MGGESETSGNWLKTAAADLRAAGVPHPRRDALLLLADALGRDKAWVLAHPEAALEGRALEESLKAVARRIGREPLQYIRMFHEFWGLRVLVGPGCLIPRPETEHLVEAALEVLREVRAPRVAEAGAGSGCVLMALASRRPEGTFLGADLSAEALAWARSNCAAYPNVRLMRADLSHEPPLRGLDLLLSNPPYITDAEWPGLPPEVRDHEPAEALRCGVEPLALYRRLAAWAAACLKPGGHLIAELGVAQARRAAALRHLHPAMEWVRSARDYAGHLRVAVWRRAG